MMNGKNLWCLGLVALLTFAQAGDVLAEALKSEVFYGIVETTEDGERRVTDRAAVRPGEMIEYRIRHENLSDGAISGLVVMGPIPGGTRFVPDDIGSTVDAVFEVQAEMDPDRDGLEWSTLPAVRIVVEADGSRTTEPLPAEDVLSVRWRLAEDLESGAVALSTYHVLVE